MRSDRVYSVNRPCSIEIPLPLDTLHRPLTDRQHPNRCPNLILRAGNMNWEAPPFTVRKVVYPFEPPKKCFESHFRSGNALLNVAEVPANSCNGFRPLAKAAAKPCNDHRPTADLDTNPCNDLRQMAKPDADSCSPSRTGTEATTRSCDHLYNKEAPHSRKNHSPPCLLESSFRALC